MRSFSAVLLGLVVAALVLFSLSLPAQAAPPAQQKVLTSTAEPNGTNGNIYHIVQPGENCSVIEAAYYGSIDPAHKQLYANNPNLDKNCTILPGQKLLMVVGGQAAAPTFTPGPPPTPAPPTITPTPFAGTTEICVLLFNDLNGDALRQADEPVIVGGAISVTEITGEYSKTLNTAANSDPTAYQGTCFSDVPEGKYNIGVAIPDNYNPTMSLTYTLNVKAGDTAFVDFGAQSRDASAAGPGNSGGGGGTSPLLGFFGGLLLLGGLGLGWYALRLRNPKSKFNRGSLLRR